MFVDMHLKKFLTKSGEPMIILPKGYPLDEYEAILMREIHYCQDKRIDAEKEIAQKIKDEESNKKPELEEAEAVEATPVPGEEEKQEE